MFQVNDIVLYNQADVCRIDEIRKMPFMVKEYIDYYVLKPVSDENSGMTTYVPIDADEKRLHRMFSADELREMIQHPSTAIRWIESPVIRKKEYSEWIANAHPSELIAMIRMLTEKRAEKIKSGHRVSESDEKLIASATKRLYPLFHYILDVEWENFLALITGENA